MKQTVNIIHDPLGYENPYRSQPFERDPRRPVEGQEITLKVLSLPPKVLDKVQVELWCDAESDKQVIDASLKLSDSDGDQWSSILPILEGGKEYSYCFIGSSLEGEYRSDAYTFEILERVGVKNIISLDEVENKLEIVYQSDKDELLLKLDLFVGEKGDLVGEWTVLKMASAGKFSSLTHPVMEFTLNDYQIKLETEQCVLSFENRKTGFFLKEASPCKLICDQNLDVASLRGCFESPNNESFYGFGERYNALDQRGNVLDNVVYEQWASQGKISYFPSPFFLSSRNYGFFIRTNRNVVFDICASEDNQWSYEAESGNGQIPGFQIWSSSEPEQIISLFTEENGKPKLPPDWAFGLWMSSHCWDNQDRVVEEVKKSIEHDISASVVVLEAWSDETTFYSWNGAEYKPQSPETPFSLDDFKYIQSGKWPDPKGLVMYLDSQQMKLVLWQIPVIKSLHETIHDYGPQPQHELDQDYVIENGFSLLDDDEKPYQIVNDQWFARSMMIDFTNPGAVEWWMNKRRYLVDELGVAGFKTDGGEQAVRSSILAHDGTRGDELKNLYPRLYLRAYAQMLESLRGDDWVLFSRAGYPGAQSYSCHWAGDQNSTWENLRACVFAGLSCGLSGVSYWGFDIGGFSNSTPSAELYLRSAALAAFSPLMQFHSIVTYDYVEEGQPQSSYDRTPWNIQEVTENQEVIEIFRKYVHVRMSLMPYILKEARKSSISGLPMMRSVAVFQPEDEKARNFPYQYFFGTDLLVAPVVEEGIDQWEVYLPEGEWIDLWTRESFIGSRVITRPADLDRMPVFIRNGAMLPLYLSDSLYLGESIRDGKHLSFLILPEDKQNMVFQHENINIMVSCQAKLQAKELHVKVSGLLEPAVLLFPGNQLAEVIVDDQAVLEAKYSEITMNEMECWGASDGLIAIKLFPGGKKVTVQGYRPRKN